MDPWLNPGMRWLLIVVTALNVAGLSGLVVTGLSMRLFIVPMFPMAEKSVRTFAMLSMLLCAQSAGWLILAVSIEPRVWPLLCAAAAGVCLTCFLLGWALMLLHRDLALLHRELLRILGADVLREVMATIGGTGGAGRFSRWRSRWLAWRRKQPNREQGAQ